MDFREDSQWVQLAKSHWLETKPRKVKPEVIKQQFWDVLEAEGFSNRSLLILENLNILEKYHTPCPMVVLGSELTQSPAGSFGRLILKMLPIITSF